MIQQLTAKYGQQFSGDLRFTPMVKTEFTLVESKTNFSDSMHALKFAALVNFQNLLQAPAVAPVAGAINPSSFFAEPARREVETVERPAAGAGGCCILQ